MMAGKVNIQKGPSSNIATQCMQKKMANPTVTKYKK